VILEPIVLTGYLDQYAAEELKARVLPLLDEQGDVIFDFTEVDRMHAASLQVLLALKKEIEPNQRAVVLNGIEEPMRNLLRLAGTEDLFQFSGDA